MEQVIDARAGHIFNQFIVPDTPHQINLGYDSLSTVMAMEDKLETMRAREKLVMFDQCVPEIEMLIYVSVLTHFYDSEEFKKINRRREQIALGRIPTEDAHQDVPASHTLRGYSTRMPSLYDAVEVSNAYNASKNETETGGGSGGGGGT